MPLPNEDRFVRPTQLVHGEDAFKDNEVGLTHPHTAAFVRLKDNGDVEIVAGEGLAIVMHPAQRSISFIADSIKFFTRDRGGLRWNSTTFNEQATSFQEPTLLGVDDQEASHHLFKGVEYFLYDDDDDDEGEAGVASADPIIPADLARKIGTTQRARFPEIEVRDPETGAMITWRRYYQKYGRPPRFGSNGR